MYKAKLKGDIVRVAIDLYGVILAVPRKTSDVIEFVEHMLENAETSLQKLSENKSIQLYIITVANAEREEINRNMMRSLKLHNYVPENRWLFARHHHAKKRVCLQNKIDYLVDDNKDICKQSDVNELKTILFVDWKSFHF